MWNLIMHSSKFFHVHLPLQHIPFITTNPSAPAIDPTLSFFKQSSQVSYFEFFPVLNSHLFFFFFFIRRVGAELDLDSAPSSHFLIQTPLKYSLYALFLLPLLPFPSTQCKRIDSLLIKAKQ